MADKFGAGNATFTLQVAWRLKDADEHRDDDDTEDDNDEVISAINSWVDDAFNSTVEDVGPNSNRDYIITRWDLSEGELPRGFWEIVRKALRYVENDTYFDLDERNQFKQALSVIEMKIVG